jgi:hypothetical protein
MGEHRMSTIAAPAGLSLSGRLPMKDWQDNQPPFLAGLEAAFPLE